MSNLSEEEVIEKIKHLIKSSNDRTDLLSYLDKKTKESLQGLLDLYQQEKEKNKELELDLEEMTKSNEHKKEHWVHKAVLNSYINKDKIKIFIEENTKHISFGEQDTYLQGQRDENDEIMDKLLELLEEE